MGIASMVKLSTPFTELWATITMGFNPVTSRKNILESPMENATGTPNASSRAIIPSNKAAWVMPLPPFLTQF